ncbi:MAG: stage II sporulation protein M [Cytophagaceae bacterium]|jgi:uncharacterized membrane protein SpoIIM required for sporulation|nr:stage II sporulation protein M [Cytophagaceae bacterium]
MREALFLKNNYQKWKEAEEMLRHPDSTAPDRLADMYLELNDDLAFAQTNYPTSKSTIYLNGITTQIYQQIYKNKRERSNRLVEFWITELPQELYKARKYFFYSLLLFGLATLVGAMSTYYDEEYVRTILGDEYVNMTISNIEKGDPLAVYGGDSESSSAYRITLNNIQVSFMAFVLGVFLSLGTAYVLYINGTMLGAFFCFFYQRGILGAALMGVMIHGVLELSAIVLAGGAGIMLGNSILYPGTYSRMLSFAKGAKTGIKIIIGLIPLFVIAGTLEGFVTRHYATMPFALNVLILVLSSLIILGYYLVYPIWLHYSTKSAASSISLEVTQGTAMLEGTEEEV